MPTANRQLTLGQSVVPNAVLFPYTTPAGSAARVLEIITHHQASIPTQNLNFSWFLRDLVVGTDVLLDTGVLAVGAAKHTELKTTLKAGDQLLLLVFSAPVVNFRWVVSGWQRSV